MLKWIEMLKSWQTSLNKEPSKGGKKGTKREDPSLSQKSKTQSGPQWGKGTNHVPKPSLVIKSVLKRK
jgi:hypothetical protein